MHLRNEQKGRDASRPFGVSFVIRVDDAEDFCSRSIHSIDNTMLSDLSFCSPLDHGNVDAIRLASVALSSRRSQGEDPIIHSEQDTLSSIASP